MGQGQVNRNKDKKNSKQKEENCQRLRRENSITSSKNSSNNYLNTKVNIFKSKRRQC